MARGIKTSISERITKQEERVAAAKEKYDAEVEKLQELQDKANDEKKEELLAAIESSGKSLDDVLEYIKG